MSWEFLNHNRLIIRLFGLHEALHFRWCAYDLLHFLLSVLFGFCLFWWKFILLKVLLGGVNYLIALLNQVIVLILAHWFFIPEIILSDIFCRWCLSELDSLRRRFLNLPLKVGSCAELQKALLRIVHDFNCRYRFWLLLERWSFHLQLNLLFWVFKLAFALIIIVWVCNHFWVDSRWLQGWPKNIWFRRHHHWGCYRFLVWPPRAPSRELPWSNRYGLYLLNLVDFFYYQV